ncbi:hypothetical protein [Croceicoccus hydrothermalis]|uniref:hypothetical protein n=1 Tax=Croceicoccus hydrothermalis TaxID=2867964 RepID=UPI001EFA4D52|nr:hypothetical protein [Croceicoccus hydrothermalis]
MDRPSFLYREFGERFGDIELWPLFEVILKDERIVGAGLSRRDGATLSDRAAPGRNGVAGPAVRQHDETSDADELARMREQIRVLTETLERIAPGQVRR